MVRLALRFPCVVAELPHGTLRCVRHREGQAATLLLRVDIDAVDLQASKDGVVLAESTGAHYVSCGHICRSCGALNRRSTVAIAGLLHSSCGGYFRGGRARVLRAAEGGAEEEMLCIKGTALGGCSFVLGYSCVQYVVADASVDAMVSFDGC